MGNSAGCCSKNSDALIKMGDKDLNSSNNNNKHNDNIKVVNEIESKSNTNEVTNNINSNFKNIQNNIQNLIPSTQKCSGSLNE